MWRALRRGLGVAPVPSPLAQPSHRESGMVRPDSEPSGPPEVAAAARVPSVVYSPARSMVLLRLHGHSRSLIVSSASAEHGASTGVWAGALFQSLRACTTLSCSCAWEPRQNWRYWASQAISTGTLFSASSRAALGSRPRWILLRPREAATHGSLTREPRQYLRVCGSDDVGGTHARQSSRDHCMRRLDTKDQWR